MAKNRSVYGIYSSRMEVEEAVDALKAGGYRSEDISVLFPDNRGTKDFAVEKNTKAPEGTATGAMTGAALGGALGWLAGIGALAIPGIGPFVAAGPIVAALSGAGAGAIGGGIVGALVGMGLPEYEAKRYEGRIRKGGILLSVHCDDDDWAKRAKDILTRTGAQDIASGGEAKADFARADKPHPRSRAESALHDDERVRTAGAGGTYIDDRDERALRDDRIRDERVIRDDETVVRHEHPVRRDDVATHSHDVSKTGRPLSPAEEALRREEELHRRRREGLDRE